MKKNLSKLIVALVFSIFFGGILIGDSYSQDYRSQRPDFSSQKSNIDKVKLTARKITVKISSTDTYGSGTIIGFQKPYYQVLTNAHVLRGDHNNLTITTSDQRQYPVHSIRLDEFKPNDLAIITFSEQDKSYPVAIIGDSSKLRVDDLLVSAGFPADINNFNHDLFKATHGLVYFLAPKPLKEGYSIGYTNPIEKGMSGGPILNLAGELVAINGIHSYPLWGDFYYQEDLPTVSSLSTEEMNSLSWALPINLLLKYR